MTREIKFRAWDKELKILHPVQDLQFGNNGKTHVFLALGEDVCSEGFAPEKFDLMQYTGLKDKNGKEIYENDLIKTNAFVGGLKTYVVEWDKFGAWWHLRNVDDGEDVEFAGKGIDNITLYSSSEWNTEIIGNIYENPKLLEAKND